VAPSRHKRHYDVADGLERGDRAALQDLTPLVYDELRRLAALQLRRERRGHTLQTTALAHEAYVRLTKPACGGRTPNIASVCRKRRRSGPFHHGMPPSAYRTA
jgi:hypothetical protein